jgi:hypothetical protein
VPKLIRGKAVFFNDYLTNINYKSSIHTNLLEKKPINLTVILMSGDQSPLSVRLKLLKEHKKRTLFMIIVFKLFLLMPRIEE